MGQSLGRLKRFLMTHVRQVQAFRETVPESWATRKT
jgi:hypothetical protein